MDCGGTLAERLCATCRFPLVLDPRLTAEQISDNGVAQGASVNCDLGDLAAGESER